MTFPARIVAIHHHLPPQTDAELAWREACYKFLGAAMRGACPRVLQVMAHEMYLRSDALRRAKTMGLP